MLEVFATALEKACFFIRLGWREQGRRVY